VSSLLDGKTILITGGTGSFGKKCTEIILRRHKPKKLIIFSRDELKQFDMRQTFSERENSCMRYFIGDVRDKERLYRAFHEVDYVIHAAALKQVPTAEYNPSEVIRTNIIGAENVINVAIDSGVKRVLAISTDKAVNPVNLYGATKLCSEKLFVAANSYSSDGTRFSVVRYGNVAGSRGSVVATFLQKRGSGQIPITDERMTRFWLTLEQGVEFSLSSLQRMRGGEIFVPKIPSIRITELAEAICPGAKLDFVGIRPGEKIREILISKDEARMALDMGTFFVVQPSFPFWSYEEWEDGCPLPDSFEYTSSNNNEWLSIEELREMFFCPVPD
jgi:UDP-N-acetylglucosamine 4,6-dehydratase